MMNPSGDVESRSKPMDFDMVEPLGDSYHLDNADHRRLGRLASHLGPTAAELVSSRQHYRRWTDSSTKAAKKIRDPLSNP